MNEEQLPAVEAAAAAREGGARRTTTERHVLSGSLFRVRARRVGFADRPPPEAAPPHEPVRRPAKVAQLLALAHHIQRAIDRGDVADRATVARKLGLTRARVSQLLDLCLLAPDVQEAVLGFEAVDGLEPMSERALRAVIQAGGWVEQRAAWATLTPFRAGTHHPLG